MRVIKDSWRMSGGVGRHRNMHVGSLEIPVELEALINDGRWPNTEEQSLSQNFKPWFSRSAVERIAPGEQSLFLYPPPFHTLQAEQNLRASGLTAEQNALKDVDPMRTVVIGDFGAGSETAVALDYRLGNSSPRVIRLEWRLPAAENCRVNIAPTFHAFWMALQQ